jgi:hypothetical protein
MAKWKPTLFIAPSTDPEQPWWLEASFPYDAGLVESLRELPGAHFAEEALGRKAWRVPRELEDTLRLLAESHNFDVCGESE